VCHLHDDPLTALFVSGIEANGVVVAVALPADSKCDVDLFNLIMHGKTFKGSIVGTRLDLIEALDFVRDGKVVPEILLKSLDDLNDVLDAFDSHFAGDTAMPAKSVVLELK
jgi:propanol-preferring alcohol dehydrogenase